MKSKRTLEQIIDLPIKRLTDEEIVIAARHLLKSKFALLAYESGNDYCFIASQKGAKKMVDNLQKAWEEKFGMVEHVES